MHIKTNQVNDNRICCFFMAAQHFYFVARFPFKYSITQTDREKKLSTASLKISGSTTKNYNANICFHISLPLSPQCLITYSFFFFYSISFSTNLETKKRYKIGQEGERENKYKIVKRRRRGHRMKTLKV